MLAGSDMRHLAPFAKQAIDGSYVKPSKRIFDNSKVSDHFAIIPTLQAPSGLSDAEQKLYDLVVKRFLSVFFPSAEFMVTTRISTVTPTLAGKPAALPPEGAEPHLGRPGVAAAVGHSFKTEGKVLVKPGWLAIWGKEAAAEITDAKEGDKGQAQIGRAHV